MVIDSQAPSGWQRGILRDAALVIRNGTPAAQNDLEVGLPVTRIETIAGGVVDRKRVKYVDASPAELSNFLLEEGDVLLSHINSVAHIGKAARVPAGPPIYHGTNLLLIRWDREKVDERFAFHAISSADARAYFQRRARKAINQASLGREDVADLPLQIPPLPEQRKIAAILSSVDETIEKTEAVIAQLDVVKKAMLEELLTRGMPGRHSRFKTTEIGEVPEGWQIAKLEEVADILDSRRKPLNSSERQSMRGPFPYFGANGQVDSISDWIFDEPLLLMAEDGGYFDEFATRPIAYLVDGKCWVNNHAHVLRIRHAMCREWIFYALVHRDIRGYINSATRSKLNQADLRRIPVPVPAISEQEEMARVLAAVDQYSLSLSSDLIAMHDVKRGLSSALLAGEVRVSP